MTHQHVGKRHKIKNQPIWLDIPNNFVSTVLVCVLYTGFELSGVGGSITSFYYATKIRYCTLDGWREPPSSLRTGGSQGTKRGHLAPLKCKKSLQWAGPKNPTPPHPRSRASALDADPQSFFHNSNPGFKVYMVNFPTWNISKTFLVP